MEGEGVSPCSSLLITAERLRSNQPAVATDHDNVSRMMLYEYCSRLIVVFLLVLPGGVLGSRAAN